MALDTAVAVADEIEQFSLLADLGVRVAAEDQRLQSACVQVLQEGAAAVDDQFIRRRFAGAQLAMAFIGHLIQRRDERGQ